MPSPAGPGGGRGGVGVGPVVLGGAAAVSVFHLAGSASASSTV
ncbi:hypothetical protein [Streptomyces sp. NBC_00233]|nr:hypothetical protein [Streptomyces sp. NBC_00233]MCX5233555.1 hypothetical protein [Streptomyces sp. NBC_00233]